MDGMLSSWAVFDQKATMINVVFKEDILSCELSLAGECLKNHSCNLHAPICRKFCLHSVAVAQAHYTALIQAKSPANCNAHLAESIFQTLSRRKVTFFLINNTIL